MQDEILTASGQIEPPGMHMIYLPYSCDIRQIDEARNISILVVPCRVVILTNILFFKE